MMCEPALIPTLSRHLLQQTMARAQGEQDPLNTHDASLPFDVKSFEGCVLPAASFITFSQQLPRGPQGITPDAL